MGKRSEYPRIDKDQYDTIDPRALPPLLSVLRACKYVEPCAGKGSLMQGLSVRGFECVFACDIAPRHASILHMDFFHLRAEHVEAADAIITNPPWTRSTLHPLIHHLVSFGKPVWLLFSADWAFTKQAIPFAPMIRRVVPTPRLLWVPDVGKFTAKDSSAWYEFGPPRVGYPVLQMVPR